MKRIATLALAVASAMLSAAAPAWAQSQDGSSYKSLENQAAADYRNARAQCATETGNARQVCQQQAKVARARAEEAAVAQYKSTPREVSRTRTAVANAEYGLARAQCVDRSASDRGTCLSDARSVQLAALADAKSGAQMAATGTTKENCDGLDTTAKAACMTRNTAGSAKIAVTDTVITTKIKADMIKDPDLKALDVHVETIHGVVMLSGFVASQTEANKAVDVARSVEGVAEVRNALKLKGQ
jgi:hyperosmotically inducible protein